jgi:signal transduction histidine kinase
MADSLLRQIFYNLVDNSLKHGKNVTQIRFRYKEGKNNLKLIYDDNGCGIPKDEKEHIF